MLFSIALILILGMFAGNLCKRFKLPSLIGMLLIGIIIGPYVLNWIDPTILNISEQIRKIALIIILTRAGLTLNVQDLVKVGRPAFMMCFLPATFELLGMIFLAPKLLGVTVLEAAIMGAAVAAVSPAVIVPKMIHLIEEKVGTQKGIPQLILAGASVDDIFVIVLFTSFISLAQGERFTIFSFINIPISIILGALIGMIVGKCCLYFFEKVKMSSISQVLFVLSISFILVTLENLIPFKINFASLISIMSIGMTLQKNKQISQQLSKQYNQLWVVGEIFLFVLVGACVDIRYAATAGFTAIVLILLVLVFRLIGVMCCLINTNLTFKEKLFCAIAYIPKATVQAAIGGLPLSLGLSSGHITLTIAVLAILITAPLGAFLIDFTSLKFLQHN